MKRIVTRKGEGKKMAQIFKCTTMTVSNAMNFKYSTDLAIKIRAYALRNGGKEVEFRD